MIRLDPSALVAAQIDHFAVPPTHAKRIEFRISSVTNDALNDLPVGTAIVVGADIISAHYAFGTLDADGAFVRTVRTPLVHVLVNIPAAGEAGRLAMAIAFAQQSGNADAIARAHARSDARARQLAAVDNLRAPGKVPKPGAAHEAIPTPSAKADDFKECDLDAFFADSAVGDPRLRGRVV